MTVSTRQASVAGVTKIKKRGPVSNSQRRSDLKGPKPRITADKFDPNEAIVLGGKTTSWYGVW